MFRLRRSRLIRTFVGLLCVLSLPLPARADRVERLLKQLKHPRQVWRTEAVKSLARLRDRRALPALLDVLGGSDEEAARMAAAEGLGALGDASACPALLKAVTEDKSAPVRRRAVLALARLGDTKVVETRVAALKNSPPWLLTSEVAMLKRFPAKVVAPKLRPVVETGAAGPAARAAYLLGWYKAPGSVDVLRKALSRKEPGKDGPVLRRAAARALGRIGDKSAAPELLEAMTHQKDLVLPVAAAVALGRIGHRPAVGPLKALLKDEDPFIRNGAAVALGMLGDAQVIPRLVKLLRDDQSQYFLPLAAEALARSGDSGRAALLAVLIDVKADFRIRGHAGWGLMQSGPEGVKKAREFLGRNELTLSSLIVGQLPMLSDKAAAIELLKEALKHSNYRVRVYAVKQVEATAGARAPEILLKALSDGSSGIRYEAAKRLAPLRDARSVKPIVAALVHPHAKSRLDRWLDVMVDLGPIACDALLAEMVSTDLSRRHHAARALGVLGPDRAVDPLLKLLSDVRSRPGVAAAQNRDATIRAGIRADVAEAVGEIGSTKATGPLLALLKDPDSHVRKIAVTALGTLGDASVTTTLVPMLSDSGRRVRAAASRALEQLQWKPAKTDRLQLLIATRQWESILKLKDPRAGDLLLKLVMDPKQPPDPGAVRAFAELAGNRAFEPLIKLLKSKGPRARLAAIEALARLGDKRAVDPLQAALTDRSLHCRRAAAVALAEFGATQAAGKIELLLADRQMQVRIAATEALVALKVMPTDPVKRACVLALTGRSAEAAKLGKPAFQPIVDALGVSDPKVRIAAATVLGDMGDKRAIEPLRKVARYSGGEVGWAAELALLKLNADGATAAAIKRLRLRRRRGGEDGIPFIKLLGERREASAIDVLIVQLRSSGCRAAAREALVKIGPKGVERLCKYLDGSFRDSREDVCWVLGEIGDASAAPALVDQMRRWGSRSRTALEALVKLGPGAVDTLIKTLEGKPSGIRDTAAQCLGRIGDARAAPALVKALTDDDRELREEAVEALRKLGPAGVKALRAAAGGSDASLQFCAVRALGQLGDKGSTGLLAGLLECPVAATRAEAARALDKLYWKPPNVSAEVHWLLAQNKPGAVVAMGARAGVPLVRLLSCGDVARAKQAAELLERINWTPKTREEKLAYLAASGDWAGLAELGDAAIPALVVAFNGNDHQRRGRSPEMLAKLSWTPPNKTAAARMHLLMGRPDDVRAMGADAYDALTAALKDTDPKVCIASVGLLADVGDRRATAILVALIKDKRSEVGIAAVGALQKMKDPAAIGPLIATLNNWPVADSAALALAHFGPAAVEPLLKVVQDPKAEGWRRAMLALACTRDPRAFEPFRAIVLAKGKRQCTAVEALGWLGDKRGGDLLPPLIAGDDHQLKSAAAIAIARLRDPRAYALLTLMLESAVAADRWKFGDELLAAEALGVLGDKRAWDPLWKQFLKRSQHRMRGVFVEPLFRLDQARAVRQIVAWAGSEGGSLDDAVKWLGEYGGEHAVRPLLKVAARGDRGRPYGPHRRALVVLEKIDSAAIAGVLVDGSYDETCAAADLLKKRSWTPRTDAQRAAMSAAAGHWLAAAKLGAPALPALAAGMRDEKARWPAAEAMLAVKPGGVKHLLALLNDADWRCRHAATWALGKGKVPRAAGALAKALVDVDGDVRAAAAEAMPRIGWKPSTPAEQARLLVASARFDEAARLGQPAVEPLKIAVGDKRPSVRAAAVAAAGAVKAPGAGEIILAALGDADPTVSAVAAGAAAQRKDPRAIPALLKLLTNWKASPAASQALARLGWTPSNDVDRTRRLLARRDGKLLLKEWATTKKILLADAAGKDPVAARNAVWGLIGLGKDEIIPDLVALLKGPTAKTIGPVIAGCDSFLWRTDHIATVLSRWRSRAVRAPIGWGGLLVEDKEQP